MFLHIISELFQWLLLSILVGGVLFWIFPPLGIAMFILGIVCGFIATIINSGVLALLINVLLLIVVILLVAGIVIAYQGSETRTPNPLRIIVSTVALAIMQLLMVNITNTGLNKITFKGPAKLIAKYTIYLNQPSVSDGQIIKIMLISSLVMVVAYEIITYVVSKKGASRNGSKKEQTEEE